MSNMRIYLSLILVISTITTMGCARWRPFSRLPLPVEQEHQNVGATSSPPAAPSRFGIRRVQLDQTGEVRSAAHVEEEPQAPSENSLDSLVDQSTNKVEGPLALARLTERKGDPQVAKRMYHEYLLTHPQNQLCYHRLAILAAKETKYDEAERYFQQALHMAPPSTELINDYGYCLFRQDRLDEAEKALLQALSREPTNQSVNNNLGLVYGAKGDYAKSLQFFRKVADEGEAHANLAFVYSQRGDLEKSREEYLKALTLDNTLRNAAEALAQVDEQYKRAEVELKKVRAKIEDVEPKPRVADDDDVIELDFPEVAATKTATESDERHEVVGPIASDSNHAETSHAGLPSIEESQATESTTMVASQAAKTESVSVTSLFAESIDSTDDTSSFVGDKSATAGDSSELRIRTISNSPSETNEAEPGELKNLDKVIHATEDKASPTVSVTSLLKMPPTAQNHQSSSAAEQTPLGQDDELFLRGKNDGLNLDAENKGGAWNVRLKAPQHTPPALQQNDNSESYPRRPLQSMPIQGGATSNSMEEKSNSLRSLSLIPSQQEAAVSTHHQPSDAERHAEGVARMEDLPSWSRHHVVSHSTPVPANSAQFQGNHRAAIHQPAIHQPTTPAGTQSGGFKPQAMNQVPVVTPEQLRLQGNSTSRISRLGSRLFQ